MRKFNFVKYAKFLLVFAVLFSIPNIFRVTSVSNNQAYFWSIQSIDTMKYSRDSAREKAGDPSFDEVIDDQMRQISSIGANYVAVDTPYDEEFVPFLKKWVGFARKYHLKIWFRGNWSSWEGWFNRPRQMTIEEHIQKSRQFIASHSDIFEDGDAFTACPECENGAIGDPRQTGKVGEYRKFLIDETKATSDEFQKIHKEVYTNWLSMNKDVAELVMDKQTVQGIGGLVVIDHYVKDPQKLADDISKLSDKTGAQIILGEFGAPIQSITGGFTPQQQASWLDASLKDLSHDTKLIGVNYWVSVGGETALWNDDGSARQAVSVISKYYQPITVTGKVKDDLGRGLKDVTVKTESKEETLEESSFSLPVVDDSYVQFSKAGYESVKINLSNKKGSKFIQLDVQMKELNPSWYDQVLKKLYQILHLLGR